MQSQLIIDRLEAKSAAAGNLPIIYAGDFNASETLTDDAYNVFMNNGYQCTREFAQTADTHGGFNAFYRQDTSTFSRGDHVITSKYCTSTMYDVLTDIDIDDETGYHVSDHCPIVTTISY